MPTVDIYSKQQVDALIASAGGLPDPASASAGDVLTLDSNKDPAWVAPSGGGSHTTVSVTVSNLYSTLNGLASGTNFIIRAHKYTNSAKFLLMELYGNRDNVNVGSATDYYVCGTMTRYDSNTKSGTVRMMETSNQSKWTVYYTSGSSNGSFNIGETATTHELLATDYVEIEYW